MKPSTTEPKAGIYVRISTDKQELENQERQLKPFCEKSGWEIYRIYRDIISGKETKRSGFDTLFRDAHQKKFDIVLFWDISRFSRTGTLYTLQKLRELENLGIRWKSFQEPYLDSGGDFRDIVISVISTIAKIEREKISERTKAGIARAKAAGKKMGRRSRMTQRKIDQAWEEYDREGSINRAAKVLPHSYGTVHFIISHRIRTLDQFLALKNIGNRQERQTKQEEEHILYRHELGR